MRKYILPVLRTLTIASALFGTITRLMISLPRELGGQTLLYFTVQSNIMVCAYLILDTFIFGSIRTPGNRAGKRWQNTHGAVLLYIIITGIIYNTMLASGHQVSGLNSVVVQFNHTLTPLLFLFDWILNQKRYSYTERLIIPWLGYPILYLVFGTIEGALIGKFRYPFLNFANQGTGNYLIGIVIVAVTFMICSQIIISINRLTGKRLKSLS